MRTRLIFSACLLGVLVAPSKADAHLYLVGASDVTAQGFGNANRIITFDSQGNDSTETGSTTVINGVLTFSGDLAEPTSDNQKFGAPTLSQLNWTNASQVQLLFNANEGQAAQDKPINIDTLTLSFYDNIGAVYSISTIQPISFLSGEPGNGSAGYAIAVSNDEQALLNQFVFNLAGSSSFRIGISASLSDVNGGADSFNAVAAVPEPSTWAMFILGFAGIALLAYRRRSTASRPA
ncbi:MAG: PEP-CTERM sorting domain-containing protein [Bradyrhizobium sp.]|uniref:PEP-CTERM sorting domain-containing protein n=1 Tax=Bradyrhizobium sp. TaxID=376 RepID=UPI0025C63B40|nr:PEP-CTERM sorting domain-containing protein [Bradyrhizobium sp.]MBI5261822.1 PEP-CTERM sorting domain-containing protein [Bradyrhizobium sp.]